MAAGAATPSDVATHRHRLAQLDVLAIAAGLWFLAKLLRYAFPPLFDPFQAIYGVSNAALGLAFTGFMLCYAAMQFPSGLLGDRFGPVRVMVGGAVVAAAGAIGLIVEAGFALLVVGMLVIGLGTGLHKTVSVTLLARVYPSRTGRALGIHETVGTAAGVVAPVGAIAFLGWTGWRSFFLVGGALALGFAAMAVVRIPPRLAAHGSTPATERADPPLRSYLGLFRHPRFALFVLVTILFAFAFNGVIAFLPLFLTDVASLPVETAGLMYSLLFAATVVQLVTGELSDRMGRLRVMGACLIGALGGLVVLLVGGGLLVLVLAVAAFGLGSHGYRPVRDAYMTTIVPADAVGGGIGLVRTLLMTAGALAPGAVGILADLAGFRAAFALLAVVLALGGVAVALLVVLPETAAPATDRPSA